MKADLLAFVLASVLYGPAAAVLADEPAPDPAAGQRVEVVGSRLPRLDGETALPVQVIGREEIERSGVTSVEELLARVSANFGGHPEALGLGDADTPGFSGASLRGFGAGETLVLLNGRRLANYAFTGTAGPGVDLHAIPLAAIARVEVLKDGASALYGSDAIAGVVNFVTRDDYEGGELTLAHDHPEAGGGASTRATLALGTGTGERFNVFGVLELRRANRLRATDRPFAATSYRPELGLDGTTPPSWPANIKTLPPGSDRYVLVNPVAPACSADTVHKGRACWFDYAKTLELLPPSQQLNAFGRGTLALSADSHAYAEVSFARTRVRFAASPTPISSGLTQTGTPFVLPETSPYYPAGLGLSGDLALAYRTDPLGPRTSEVLSHNLRGLAGVEFTLGAWDLDGALAVNDSRADESYVSGYVDAGALAGAFATGLVNPFGPSGADGDALLAATELHGLARRSRGRTQAADLRARRDLATLPGGPLGLAAGVELRHEDLRDVHMDIVADVAGGAPSGPKEGRRSVQAAYVEMLAPLVRGLEFQAAARWDHYSDFGSAVSPKLALRWQPAASWLLRASVGRGFRAPSLPELYTQQERTFFDGAAAGISDPLRCPVTGLASDCFPTFDITSGGNPALRPQRSTQAGAGLVLAPAGPWQASVDLWSIRVGDIIGALNADDVVNDLGRYDASNVVRGAADPTHPGLPGPIVDVVVVNQNLGDWRVDGADLSFALKPTPTRWGKWSARLDGTYVRRARQAIFAGNVVDLVGRLAPRWQHVLSLSLARGAWDATLSQRYRRGYLDAEPLPNGTLHHVSAYRVWDLQLGFAPARALRLWVGVRNLLDTDPPVTNQTAQFQLGYDPLYADPLGRTWTLGLRADWT
jgi:iron complex outermembrane receptor protein